MIRNKLYVTRILELNSMFTNKLYAFRSMYYKATVKAGNDVLTTTSETQMILF